MATKRLALACVFAAAAAAAATDGRAPNFRGGHARELSDNPNSHEYDANDEFEVEQGNITGGWKGNSTEGQGWGSNTTGDREWKSNRTEGHGWGGDGWKYNGTQGHGWGGDGGWNQRNDTEGHGWGGDESEGYGWNRNKTEGHDWNGTQEHGWNRNKTYGDGWKGNKSESDGGVGHGDNDQGGRGRDHGAFRQFFASVFNSLFGGGQGGWGSGGGSWGSSGEGDSGWGGHGGWGWDGDDHGLGSCGDRDVDFTTRNCSASAVIPECTFSRAGGTGSLVCRTLFNRFTGAKEASTECIDPSRSLPLDECGCCGGECPQVCPCSCDNHDGSVGVQVHKVGDSGEGFCVPSSYATTLLVRGKVECTANCTQAGGSNTPGTGSNGTAVVTANDTAV